MANFHLLRFRQTQLAGGSRHEVAPAVKREFQGGVSIHPTQNEAASHHCHCVVESSNSGGKAAPIAADGTEDKVGSRELGHLQLRHPMSSPISVSEVHPDGGPRDLATFLFHPPAHTDEGIDG